MTIITASEARKESNGAVVGLAACWLDYVGSIISASVKNNDHVCTSISVSMPGYSFARVGEDVLTTLESLGYICSYDRTTSILYIDWST